MSNNDPLTDAEFASYRPDPTMVDHLERCRVAFGIPPADFRLVDWGCGRGKLVLWLRERGYDAIGVDIDPAPFANGADLFRRKGHPPERCLYGLGPSGSAPVADSSVHFITSWQALEHVRDLDAVATEWARITMDRGRGFHIYPAHHRLVEPHLFMPFVHWLPKNAARRLAIELFVLVGVEPGWWPDGRVPRSEMARRYYEYSINDTYYRAPASVRVCLTSRGFEATFIDVRFGYAPTPTAPEWRRRVPGVMRDLYQSYGQNIGLATCLRKRPGSGSQAPSRKVVPVGEGEQRQG